MKIAFIIVTFHTPKTLITRLKSEIIKLAAADSKVYMVDNTNNNKGYAAGVNSGLKSAIKDGRNIFIVANPDISFGRLEKQDLTAGGKHFDVWGLAMKQRNKTYYGGEIDKWRLSGGLITKKPTKRFRNVDYVSGSLMLFTKKVINKIGYWDKKYFMYYEDVDFCYRAWKAGLKVGIDSKFAYLHYEVSKKTPEKQRYLRQSRWLFFQKYSNIGQKLREFIRMPKTILEEVFGKNSAK